MVSALASATAGPALDVGPIAVVANSFAKMRCKITRVWRFVPTRMSRLRQ